MRTLFVTMMPYPPIGGEFMRNWQNINIMSNFGPVAIFSIFNRENNYQGRENNNIEIWHHYNIATQFSPRTKLELGLQWLQQYGLTYYSPFLSSAAQELEELIKKFKPNIVLFEQIWLYPYLKVVNRHNCSIIFDNHNVEALLYQETKASGNGLRGWIRKKLHVPQIKYHEKKLLTKSHQVWLCSDNDSRLIKRLYGSISPNYVVPNAINVSDYDCVRLQQCSVPEQLKPKNHNILFLGNFFYIPNIEAAQILIQEIYPKIRQIYPDCRILLVGRGATKFMQKAGQQEANIIVTGEVEDVKPYLASGSVMVVPLYKAGGTRLKILEAFAAGCPVITTTKGAEGLEVEDGTHLLIADDVDAMIKSIEQIWSNENLGDTLVDSAYELVQKKYSWDAVQKCVEMALNQLTLNN